MNLVSLMGFFRDWRTLALILLLSAIGLGVQGQAPQDVTVVWKLDNPARIGGHPTEILGSPMLVWDETGTAIAFDGAGDGLQVDVNPVEGLTRFTVEVLFVPASGGLQAQRFVHFEDGDANRGLIETRLTPDGHWYIDTFLYNGETGKGLPLMDPEQLYPCDQWYWGALVYDGKTMTSYVNGVKQLEGDIAFGPMTAGRISLGVRMNEVYWFKGQIREIRFHPAALDVRALRRP